MYGSRGWSLVTKQLHKMKEFNVLTLGEKLSEEELELVIASFAELYHRVTFKHHRKIRLKVVCNIQQAEAALTLATNHKVTSNVDLVSINDFDMTDWSSMDISVLFLPTKKRVGKITRTSLSQGVPMVSFQNESVSEYIDHSCGMLVRARDYSQNKDAFSRILNMLYFDPEVRKLLKKGAQAKYRAISNFKVGYNSRYTNTYGASRW